MLGLKSLEIATSTNTVNDITKAKYIIYSRKFEIMAIQMVSLLLIDLL